MTVYRTMPSGQAYASVLVKAHGAVTLARLLGVSVSVAEALASGEQLVGEGTVLGARLAAEFDRHVDSLAAETLAELGETDDGSASDEG